MSHSSTHALSTRLFVQAAVTALLAPLTKGGSTWFVLSLAVAAGAVAVALLMRSNPANAKVAVIGFEAVAVAVGAVGIAGGHYIPGTIIGIATLVTALNVHTVPAPGQDSGWVAPQDGDQHTDAGAVMPDAPAPAADPRFAAPAMSAPMMDNPYATPAAAMASPPPIAPLVMAPPAPVMAPPAPPAPVVPEQATAPEDVAQEEPAAEAAAPETPAPAAEVTPPMRPEDIPPAPRALTILPGR